MCFGSAPSPPPPPPPPPPPAPPIAPARMADEAVQGARADQRRRIMASRGSTASILAGQEGMALTTGSLAAPATVTGR